MFDFNTSEHVSLLLDRMTALAETLVAQAFEDVKARAAHHDASPGTAAVDPKNAARIYNYDTTPGSGAQSFGAFLKGALDIFVDDLKRSRAAPDDITARWRLQMSSAIYAAAGARFADIVVHRSTVGDRDPLDRPALNERRFKHASALQASDLDSVIADAVLDAASGDPARVAGARQILRERIASGTDTEVQIAAVLLGQIGDPVEQRKINRLADQIERAGWEATATPAADVPTSHPVAISPIVTAPKSVNAKTRSQIVWAGGESARQVAPNSSVAPSGTTDIDDLDAFYGDAS